MRGEFRAILDIKGRMNFPSKLREELGNSFILSKTIGATCVKVYTVADWEELVLEIKKMPQTKTAGIQRFLFGSAFEVEADKQGRIMIPLPLREYASLTAEAVVVGLEGRAEIWNKEQWEALTTSQNMEELADIAMELGL